MEARIDALEEQIKKMHHTEPENTTVVRSPLKQLSPGEKLKQNF